MEFSASQVYWPSCSVLFTLSICKLLPNKEAGISKEFCPSIICCPFFFQVMLGSGLQHLKKIFGHYTIIIIIIIIIIYLPCLGTQCRSTYICVGEEPSRSSTYYQMPSTQNNYKELTIKMHLCVFQICPVINHQTLQLFLITLYYTEF